MIAWESVYISLALFLTVLWLLYWYGTHNYNYWKDKGAPYVKPVPFLGNISELVFARRSFSEVFRNLYCKLDGHDFGGVYQFTRPVLLVRGPDLLRQVMVKDFVHFHDRAVTINEKHDPLSAHLFNLQGSRWRNLRAKLSPTFTSGRMKKMFHLLTECGQGLTSYLQESANLEQEVEFKEILAKFTTDVIGSCAFGLEFNSMKNPDSEFRKMGKKIFMPTFAGNLKRVLLIFAPKLAQALNLKFVANDSTKFFINVVKETVAYREANNIKRNDFMDLLIQIKNEGAVREDGEAPGEHHENKNGIAEGGKVSESMTIEQIAAQAFVFFFAGFETSATTMSFALFELALNPDIQDRVRAEIKKVIKKNGGQLSYEAINEMEYLDKVVSETLRKYPPVGNLVRKCTKTYRIPDTKVVIDKDTRVIIPIYGIHYDPKYYYDPEKFLPERFSDEEKRDRPHYTYMPFGEGPRLCIGQRFGLMQTKVGLVMILSKFSVSIGEKAPVPFKLDPKSIIISGIGGMWLKIKNIQ